MRLIGPTLALLLAAPLSAADTVDPREFFELRIRPMLAKNCFTCHTSARMGGLEMSSREALLKGGATGPAIIAGDPENSLIMAAVTRRHERLKMPPTGALADTEVADLSAWIKAGAIWPAAPAAAHSTRSLWSLEPVRKPAPPEVKDARWARSPVDRFILARLEQEKLKPVAAADKRTLLRRATYDLTGLPPAPDEIDAFLKDTSPDAFAKIVDRLLASPRYGERWGRHWLDLARYSDDKLNPTEDEAYANAFRYRDWVIQAFNEDMPYDVFLKAQLAADQMETPDRAKLVAGLGFYALSPQFHDDRVDATTRGFLGFTVACAQCHDHKFDPIPTRDYYSLLGIFTSTQMDEFPLAPAAEVTAWKAQKKQVDDREQAIKDFLATQARQLSEILAEKTAAYLIATVDPATGDKLDAETLDHWRKYLALPAREHPYLQPWIDAVARKEPLEKLRPVAAAFQDLAIAVNKERKEIEEKNLIRLGGSKERRTLSNADLLSLERDKYFLWRDLFEDRRLSKELPSGVFYYKDKTIERFLSGAWLEHLESLRAELAALKSALPPQYPFVHAIKDSPKPANARIQIRGNRDNLGDEAPRQFLSALSNGKPKAFTKGSGRLELAEAIADPRNPLTPRVMVNRIWQQHFGAGLVRTTSNFGQLGERPSHPELLDYLASRFVEEKWSIKALHREIMLSSTYALAAADSPANSKVDAANRFLWRANRRRLDVESLRDSMLVASGTLDLSAGGKATPLEDVKNNRRTVYGFVSRRRLDPTLLLFDFPNPNSTSEQRESIDSPLQRLYFLNSSFILRQAEALAKRVAAVPEADRIKEAYRILFGRVPTTAELRLGREFLAGAAANWPRYAQVLLGSNEFLFLN